MKLYGQSGITLAEVLVASAIGLTIIVFLGTAIFQFFTITGQGNDLMTALHQVQNAGHWFSRDGQTASTAIGGDSLVLTIPNSATVTYALSGDELTRTSNGSQLTVARNVGNVDFYIDGSVITMDINSGSNSTWGIHEQLTYKACLRPTGGG